MNTKTAIASMLGLIVGAGALAGCTGKTESEMTRDKSQQLDQAADTLARGEAMERDGNAMVARGQTLKQQGDMSGGDAMIRDGNAKVRQGQSLIASGRAMKK